MATTRTPVPKRIERPEFTTERLDLDAESAADIAAETLAGLSVTETDEGITFRTLDGRLVAVVTGTHYEDPAVELHYRTAPAWELATLKARRLWRALEPYAD